VQWEDEEDVPLYDAGVSYDQIRYVRWLTLVKELLDVVERVGFHLDAIFCLDLINEVRNVESRER
jgi:hypothetical protein